MSERLSDYWQLAHLFYSGVPWDRLTPEEQEAFRRLARGEGA